MDSMRNLYPKERSSNHSNDTKDSKDGTKKEKASTKIIIDHINPGLLDINKARGSYLFKAELDAQEEANKDPANALASIKGLYSNVNNMSQKVPTCYNPTIHHEQHTMNNPTITTGNDQDTHTLRSIVTRMITEPSFMSKAKTSFPESPTAPYTRKSQIQSRNSSPNNSPNRRSMDDRSCRSNSPTQRPNSLIHDVGRRLHIQYKGI